MIEVNISLIDMRVYFFFFIWQGLGSGGSFCEKRSGAHTILDRAASS